ncbi:hypothetical protein GCM10027347_52510 [Larkinella harenae]
MTGFVAMSVFLKFGELYAAVESKNSIVCVAEELITVVAKAAEPVFCPYDNPATNSRTVSAKNLNSFIGVLIKSGGMRENDKGKAR